LIFGYTGKMLDEATGLQNNLNRWYDSQTGRWISQDPIGFAGGDANLYRYVGNSPTNATDPSGLEEQIGWIYEVSVPDGDGGWKVAYVGKADDLSARLSDPKHPARAEIDSIKNRIRVKPIFAEPNVGSTERGTPRAALDQAQRSMEQRVMGDDLPEKNSIRAASVENQAAWEEAHKARLGRFRSFSLNPRMSAGMGTGLGIAAANEGFLMSVTQRAACEGRLSVVKPDWGGGCADPNVPQGYVFANGQLTYEERAGQYHHNFGVFLRSWLTPWIR